MSSSTITAHLTLTIVNLVSATQCKPCQSKTPQITAQILFYVQFLVLVLVLVLCPSCDVEIGVVFCKLYSNEGSFSA